VGEYSALTGIHDGVFDVMTTLWAEYSRVVVLIGIGKRFLSYSKW
jgi:hypothetical protein